MVDAVAAINVYGAPAIVVDIGTATTISVVDEKKNYIGGVIMPGIRVSLDSLVSRTSSPNTLSFINFIIHIKSSSSSITLLSSFLSFINFDGVISPLKTDF